MRSKCPSCRLPLATGTRSTRFALSEKGTDLISADDLRDAHVRREGENIAIDIFLRRKPTAKAHVDSDLFPLDAKDEAEDYLAENGFPNVHLEVG